MNLFIQLGSTIVLLALVFYSIGVYNEQKQKAISKKILLFLSFGLLFDITATLCMIKGSSNGLFTLHGFIGYSALLAMLTDTILLWRIYITNGNNNPIPKSIHKYTLFAYLWWVIAFITGGLLVMIK